MARRSRFDDFWHSSYTPSKPRPAKGGIQAKSRRGQVGETWWSRRFIAVLESFRIGARLERGRRYARLGQVMDLEIAPGVVTAKVQGSRARPYDVRIQVKTLPEKDWAKVEQHLAGQALFLARLLAGEMPPDIEDAFAACRLSLFPASTRDLETSCSCPDWSNPCKHVAATYYILAERFDEDPFLVLAWRGRTRDLLLDHLRALRSASGPGGRAPLSPTAPASSAAPPPPPPPTAAPQDLSAFWTGSVLDLVLRPEPPAVPDAILREAGPLGVDLSGRDAIACLAPAYAAMTAGAAAWEARGEAGAED